MDRLEMCREIVKRYNNKEGTITELTKDYGDSYNRSKFNRDVKSLNINRDIELDKYIIPVINVEGQLDILEGTEGATMKADTKVIENMGHEVKSIAKGKGAAKEMTIEDNKVVSDIKVIDPMERKKKTFEIDIDLEQLIRVQAAILNITINDYVNKVLRKSIPEDIKNIIK